MLEKIIDKVENIIFFLSTRNPEGRWITVEEVPESAFADYMIQLD